MIVSYLFFYKAIQTDNSHIQASTQTILNSIKQMGMPVF